MLRELQKRAFQKWKENKIGTIVLPTGTGKSFVGLLAAGHICESIEKPTILFLAETTAREKTLRAEILKFEELFNIKLPSIRFKCYQSAHKLKDYHYNLVIADEIHSAGSEKYHRFFMNNSFDYCIGLTATPRLDKEYTNLIYSKVPIIFEATIKDAVDAGDILDYELVIVDHKLDSKDKYIKAKNFLTTEKSNYEFNNKLISKAYYMNNEGLLKLLIARRSLFLYDLKSKEGVVRKLISDNPDKKIIIFGNSLNFLKKVCDHVVEGSDRTTLDYVDMFNEDKIKIIGSFKMLEQGANLKGANMIILASYYSISGTFLQRIGRALRRDSEMPKIYVIRTLDTVEETWVKKMTTT